MLMFLLLSSIFVSFGFSFFSIRSIRNVNRGLQNIVSMAVPLELEGELDPSKSWDVKLIFNGIEKIVKVPEDTSVLEIGEKVFKGVQSSCRNGVCTTCSGQVRKVYYDT